MPNDSLLVVVTDKKMASTVGLFGNKHCHNVESSFLVKDL